MSSETAETHFDLQGNTWENIPMPAKTVRAKVIAPTTINNKPAKVGDVVEVCENTFRNLSEKGRLELAEPKKRGKDKESDNEAAE